MARTILIVMTEKQAEALTNTIGEVKMSALKHAPHAVHGLHWRLFEAARGVAHSGVRIAADQITVDITEMGDE